jgi:hypothetical protein
VDGERDLNYVHNPTGIRGPRTLIMILTNVMMMIIVIIIRMIIIT